MTFEIHIVNRHTDKDGFLVMSENVNPRYQQLMQESYKLFYKSKKKFPDGPHTIAFNDKIQLWEKVLKIKDFDSQEKARSFAFEWANRPGFSKRGRLKIKEQAGCSLDILIVDVNGTVVQELSSDELFSRGIYANKEGANKPTNG